MPPLPSRLAGRPVGADVLVLVGDDGVRVRLRLGRPEPWRCQACGPMTKAGCAHTFSAALRVAHDLLGLTLADGQMPPVLAPEGKAHR